MSRRKIGSYPGVKEAERQKSLRKFELDKEPDCWCDGQSRFVPNYEKFERMGMTVEEVLVWLNID